MDWLDIGRQYLSALCNVEGRPRGLVVVSAHGASMAAMADLWRECGSLLLEAKVSLEWESGLGGCN